MGLSMKALSYKTSIDQALISKYENDKRKISDKHILALSIALEMNMQELKKEVLAKKIMELVQYETEPSEILMVAETRIEFLSSKKKFQAPVLDSALQQKLEKIDVLKNKWNQKKPLDKTHLSKMNAYFDVKYAFNSNQIEGNTLTYKETELVIQKGLTIEGKSMREHLEAINHSDATAYLSEIISNKAGLDLRLIKQIHYLILKSIDRANAGFWRSVPVRISGSEHIPPQPYMIDTLMQDYILNYQKQRSITHPVILAAEMHERLVSIHPFVDGNGRTSRLIMNFILLQNDYTIAILKGNTNARLAYYEALENVQVHNNPSVFYHFIADSVLESLQEHLEWINDVQ